ncbi:Flagellar biosynthesis protein FliK [Thiovulum sp. ES]|nr:Flagellar biosynthesis protein FliK [Thiovulum sp. ES]
MLEKILSSESVKSTSQSGKSTKAIESESSQFSKILASIDESAGIKGESKISKDAIFDNLQELFQDDKEFLKESFQFLKGDEKLATETSSKQNVVFGLNFGGGVEPKSDQDFLVVINKAKEFLKTELLKQGTKGEEIPQTLRGLSQLAESKGIKLKDIKFDLNSESVKQGGVQIQSEANSLKAVVSQHSTSELLQRNNNRAIKRTNFTDQIPENLSATKTSGTAETQKFDLASILSGKALETKETPQNEKSSLNLSAGNKSLSDILKIDEVADQKVEVPTKSLAMAEKVGKSLSMTPEFVSSLFTKEEMKDILGTATETVSETGFGEISEESAISSVEKGRVQLKIGEAQIMSRHLATNLQQQVENYKHPFQKMSLTLNPERLGEIEVDIFKRGNSVKISLSGNAQTMGILSANQLELRTQLVNVGLENASFKFNEDGSNGQSQYREQKQEQEVDEELKALFEIDVEEIAS